MKDYTEVNDQLNDAYDRLEGISENDVEALSALHAEIAELEYYIDCESYRTWDGF